MLNNLDQQENLQIEFGLKAERWQLVPVETPIVNKYCSKCGGESHFINTHRFRVNANKKRLDVWMIFQCEHCKSTWNMTVHERMNPKAIGDVKLEGFMNNNEEQIYEIAFDHSFYKRNKVVTDFSKVAYDLEKLDEAKPVDLRRKHITISCDYPLGVKVIKVLSEGLNLSVSKVKKLFENEGIMSTSDVSLLKERIENQVEVMIEIL